MDKYELGQKLYEMGIELSRIRYKRKPTSENLCKLAYKLICDTANQIHIDEGLAILEELNTSEYMEARAILGFALSRPWIYYPVDLKRSMELLISAADAGNPRAEGIVAHRYFNGIEGFEKDPILGHYYMLEGVKHGDIDAIRMKQMREYRLGL